MSGRRILRGERFSRGPWRESPFHKGDLKYVILDLIKEKPRYGYEIIRDLEELSHGFYTPSPGVVYPTLQMLEETGYASAAERDGKKHQWNPKNIDVIGKMMVEFGEIGLLLRRRLRHAEPEKVRSVRRIVSRAYQEIEGILEE